MIDYNPKEWFTFIFRFHKADTLRKLAPLILSICVYALLIVILEKEVLQLSENNHLKNIPVMHTMLGLVISLLLVFRTNTAYDRWWEGRRLWGSLVNNTRGLALKIHAITGDNHTDMRKRLAYQISAFPLVLKEHLRGQIYTGEQLQEMGIDTSPSFEHQPNQVVHSIFRSIQTLRKSESGFSDELYLSLQPELQSFSDICGGCERIKKTPIPFSYSVFLKKFIFFYIMTLPFGFVFTVGYWTVPVVAFIFYVLASLELIAEEIEDPFGKDANDIPTDQLAETIGKNVREIIISTH